MDSCDPFAGVAADDSVCDGRDNDCDGAVDEEYQATATTCGVGQCAGNTGKLICVGGSTQDTCDPLAGATPEICDALDNDCDGEIDDQTPDLDADGLCDELDNCPANFNPNQEDGDGDGAGNACDPDHFLSYQIKDSDKDSDSDSDSDSDKKSGKIKVFLQDQFGSGTYRVEKAVALLNPADKNGEGIGDRETHLTGYSVKGPKFKKVKGVIVEDQFGQLTLTVKKPDRLLVPSAKSLGPDPLPEPDNQTHFVDHFLCYTVDNNSDSDSDSDSNQGSFPTVSVEDQFGAKSFRVMRPERLCTPVDKEGEGIKKSENHLMCYRVKPARGEPRHRRVKGVLLSNQFGVIGVDTIKERELCLPATKTLP